MKRVIASIITVLLIAGIAVSGEKKQRNLPGRIINAAGLRQAGTPRGTPAGNTACKGALTAAKIQAAINNAVKYLRSCQKPDGSIPDNRSREGGTALAVLAILASGANPAGDACLKKALNWLIDVEVDNIYVRAIRANVWEYALRKVPKDERIRAALKKDYEWLMKALGDREGWRYRMSSRDWDNSCTQYGVLGVWAALRAGFDPGDAFWKTMSNHFRSCQNADGGWSYMRGGSTPNMTTAGLATMFLIFDMYHGKSFYSADKPRAFTSGEAAECLASISRGMEWLGKSKGCKDDAYYLYGIERTGVAGGRKYIGGEDWFKRGALTVLGRQQAKGEISLGRWGGPVVSTSFCVLFLVCGGAPVAFNKLEYGKGQDWNLNPRDLANLTRGLWPAYERPLNWNSVSIGDPASEFEAPILFISGSKAAAFSEEETLKLREYILNGGTVFAEPSDRSKAFAESMAALVRQMFPEKEYPAYGLKPLPAEHGIYAVIEQDWKKRPDLLGVSDGSRTFFFLSKEYMSADWQMNRAESDAFKLGTNLLFYVSDLGMPGAKYASVIPETPAAAERKETVTVARVKYTCEKERPMDWAAGSVCWKKFAPYFRHVTGLGIEERKPVDLASGDLSGIRMLHITGRGSLTLSEKERAALKRYVKSGGTLFVDAYAGSRKFADSAGRELESTFGKLEPLGKESALASGGFAGGTDLDKGIRFKLPARRLLREKGLSTRGQKLEVVMQNGRPAVIFSAFDLTAAIAGVENYRSISYKPASARKIMTNVLSYITPK
jgi:hypothetical protein